MNKETWKAIPGYEGYYEVSDLGNVSNGLTMMALYKNLKQKLNMQDRRVNNMSEYNENNIHGELEEILDSAFNKYVAEENEYQDACVKLFERTVANEPEVKGLIESFIDAGCTEVKAKAKVIDYILKQY